MFLPRSLFCGLECLGVAGTQVGLIPGDNLWEVALLFCLGTARLLQSRFWRAFGVEGNGWSLLPGGGRACGALSPILQWPDGNASLSCMSVVLDSPSWTHHVLNNFVCNFHSPVASQPKVGLFSITVLHLSNSPLVSTSSTSLEHLWEKREWAYKCHKKMLVLIICWWRVKLYNC